MAEFKVTLKMRPPSLVEKVWYWSLGLRPPLSCSAPRHREAWVRLLPQRWAMTHEKYARKHNLFWMPCILCTAPYGGHQSAGSVPDPEYGPGSGRTVGICPRCTRRGSHVELPPDDLPVCGA